MHDFLNHTGIKAQVNISTQQILDRVQEVETQAISQRPSTPFNSKGGFDLVVDSKREARNILHFLGQKRHAKALSCFGYNFTFNDVGNV